MTQGLKSAIEQHRALKDKLADLTEKESLTPRELKSLEDLPAELDAAEAAVKRYKAAEDRLLAAEGFDGGGRVQSITSREGRQTGYGGEEISPRDLRGKSARNRANASIFWDNERAGTELVNAKSGLPVDSEGWGLSVKQFQAISEDNYKNAFTAVVIRGKGDSMDAKTLISGIDGDGGFLAPPEYMAELISRDPYPTEILTRLRTVPCARDRVIWPRNQYDPNTADIYTSPVRLTFSYDQSSAPELDPTFGDVEIPIWTGNFPIQINRNLLEDSAIPVGALVQELAGEAYRLGLDNYVVSGTGNNQPYGLLTNAGGNFPGLPTQNIGVVPSANGLSNLTLLLPPQYREDRRSVALLTSSANFANFATIQDASGQYIYGLDRYNGPGSMTQERVDRHMGYDVCYSAFVPNVAAGAACAVFGDFKKAYVLAQRVGLSVFPYGDQDRSMLATNQVGWFFRCRVGGGIVQNRACHVAICS
jgi:HK97 family phage major capsid protein